MRNSGKPELRAIHLLRKTLFEERWMRGSSPRMTGVDARGSAMDARQAGCGRHRRNGYGTALCLERSIHPLTRHVDELLDDRRIVGERREANALAGVAFKFLRWR